MLHIPGKKKKNTRKSRENIEEVEAQLLKLKVRTSVDRAGYSLFGGEESHFFEEVTLAPTTSSMNRNWNNRPFYSCVLNAWPLNRSDAEGDLVSNILIPTTRDNDHLNVKNWTVCKKTVSLPGSLLFKGQGTQHTTVTWPTVNDLIDLSRIPVNKVTNSRLGSLSCLLTGT